MLVEPGTPAGFERLRGGEEVLIGLGAQGDRPVPARGCLPHDRVGLVPLRGAPRAKSRCTGNSRARRLGYEDEKYAYLVVSPAPLAARQARLVRSPRRHKGHVRLVCARTGGFDERVVSRRDGELYKQARSVPLG